MAIEGGSANNDAMQVPSILHPKIFLFAVATLAPIPLLGMGSVYGGSWLIAATVYLSIFAFLLDELITVVATPAAPDTEFPTAELLSQFLAIAHFPLLGLGVWTVSGGANLSGPERLLAFLAFGLFFGQISNSNAHELIHNARRRLHQLGKWVFISFLFGHHTSAHRLVHHRFVGTSGDPNSAPIGQSFYGFAWRAWRGSFVEGLRAEIRLRHKSSDLEQALNPYVEYLAGSGLMLFVAGLIGGWPGILAYFCLSSYAVMQLLMSDYVQHYGLSRARTADGKPEPVGPQHSWNARHWFSAHLMLNAPRHSDHHAHPSRPFPALSIAPEYPTLPHSLPVMGFIALFPRRWHKLMDGPAIE